MTRSITNTKPSGELYGHADRLIGFSDGVIAIAVTLLILPLVDNASELRLDSLDVFISDVAPQFLIFLLSFVVICRYWLVHHNLFRFLKGFNGPLFWLNALWLLSIVVIPFPTELLGRIGPDVPFVTGLYIANLLVTALAGVAIERQIKRHPELRKDDAPTPSLALGSASVLLLFVALIISVVFPSVGPWSLLLLFGTSFVTNRLLRFQK